MAGALADYHYQINGMVTLDRKVVKVEAAQLRAINQLFNDDP